MKYDFANMALWNSLHAVAQSLGTDLKGLDRLLFLSDGTLELMEEYGIRPEGELLSRLVRFTGMTPNRLISGEPDKIGLEVGREIFVLRNAEFVKPYYSIENILRRLCIDLPPEDKRSYVGLKAWDDSMSRANIYAGDLLI
ncbi:MAG: hypothetical protein ACI4SS_02725, partial [Clostridia bacterium]